MVNVCTCSLQHMQIQYHSKVSFHACMRRELSECLSAKSTRDKSDKWTTFCVLDTLHVVDDRSHFTGQSHRSP